MSPFLPPELHSLLSTYPCRDTQFGTLYSLLGHPDLPSPPSICLTGFPATGKRTVTRAFLDAVRVQYAWIDCAETVSSALLFYRILHCLRKMVVETETEAGKVGGDINAFVVQVQKLMHQLQGKIVLVLDKAHYLPQLTPDTLFSVLARLPTLISSPSAHSQLTILFLTTSIPARSLSAHPLPTIPFTPYPKPQLLKILALHCPTSLYTTPPSKQGDLDIPELQKTWETLCSAIIDTYGPGTSIDVPSILNLGKRLWPDFVKPIIEAGIFDQDENEVIFGRVDVVGLFALAKRKGLFRGEEIVKQDFTFKPPSNMTGIHSTETVGLRDTGTGLLGTAGSGYELPEHTKFLLVAAFLASFNPTKDDARIFSRDSGLKKRRKRAGQKSNKGIAKMSQRLIGPRVFELERMLAIFHSITNYKVLQTIDIHMQVATLGTLRLIVRANKGDPLVGGGRWRVNVPEEEIRRIAGSVDFKLNDHLVD